jgi:VanZ family protein
VSASTSQTLILAGLQKIHDLPKGRTHHGSRLRPVECDDQLRTRLDLVENRNCIQRKHDSNSSRDVGNSSKLTERFISQIATDI